MLLSVAGPCFELLRGSNPERPYSVREAADSPATAEDVEEESQATDPKTLYP